MWSGEWLTATVLWVLQLFLPGTSPSTGTPGKKQEDKLEQLHQHDGGVRGVLGRLGGKAEQLCPVDTLLWWLVS